MGYLPGVGGAGCGPCGPIGAGFWTSTGVILVLYILLVIILRAGVF
ncbi:YjcZ family sporulation protein [Paenibacillus sp. sptzw28]|nr:YjcZ family sporulation protein [Paenibacillus sp. sptzw28]QYR23645.1 YjcZ family sporulation protein [Paenibacillus sp. sptzw28]